MKRLSFVVCALALACSTSPAPVTTDNTQDTGRSHDAAAELVAPDLPTDGPEVAVDVPDLLFDSGPDTPFVECAPGDGCFLDPCKSNDQCKSGWCVEHMGDGVCTQLCTEECPPGWSCKPVGSGGPDLTYVCVSGHANLCRPCSAGADCKSVGGNQDHCLDYGEQGSFCGGACLSDEECPWGFSCGEAVTVDGISTLQCLADAGVCPCTSKSIELSLFTPCEIANEFGTCKGKRFCTEEGLTECDAAAPSNEICNGIDDDCDGSVDEPEEHEGKLLLPCDDDNPCTEDVCEGEAGCAYTLLTKGECLDGDACTIGDHCEEGVCVGAPIDCDDENPCTDDACDGLGGCLFVDNAVDCDDGNECTVADECNGGVCAGVPVNCDCKADADCAAFEDGNVCNGTLVCSKEMLPYQCKVDPETVVACEPPEGLNAFCLAAVCDPDSGTCEIVPAHEGLACNDDDPCTIGETCTQGICKGGVPANCNDGNPCTDDGCTPAAGCTHAPNTLPCQDGNACTIGDQCDNGECLPGTPANCNDSNPCTDDACDSVSGCTHAANAAACDDGNACTTGDHCQGGSCVPTSSLSCDDKNPCTDDSCLPGGGCEHVPNAKPCSDQNACTLNDVCADGLCTPGPTLGCNDGNPCTTDSCDQKLGCLFEANELPCDDKNACTLNDTCKAGSCQSTLALDCNDGNVCTTDGCSPVQGCVHALNTAPCDDGNKCTTKDQCQLGECLGSQPLLCNDNNPCTDDSCAPQAGCTFVANAAACDDGNACTENDQCANGWCAGAAVSCDDGNPCTIDSCNPAEGCAHSNSNEKCDDGDACTSGDVCADGECAGPGTVNCDDGNLCTDDSCDSDTGCVYANNTKSCNDANACTVTDVCSNGACVGSGAPDCDDGNKCTSDTCDSQSGCLHTPITPCCGNGVKEGNEECDDGNEINGDGCDSDCTAPPVADWRIGTWNGVAVYGFKTCPSGDYYCQAKDACEQATGATCVWQSYNCSSYPNENGSFYPTSNPMGRSVSTSGSSDLNWTVTSGCAASNGPCDHGNSNVYGNLCCCSCPNPNQYWNEGNNFCGVGIWEPY